MNATKALGALLFACPLVFGANLQGARAHEEHSSAGASAEAPVWMPDHLLQLTSTGGSSLLQSSLLSSLFGRISLGNWPAIDFNPHPRVFETYLVAKESTARLKSGLVANVQAFNGKLPGPEFRVRVGDRVIVHFKNELPIATTIHWHGVELNNASDGTGVTQNEMETGDTYTYDFTVPRPGVFWYHTHIKPTNPTFKGMYGAFIATDRDERKLSFLGVLPSKWMTHTMVLSDITVCKAPGQNDTMTFPPIEDTNDFPTPAVLCDTPLDKSGNMGGPPLAAGDVPNVQPASDCRDSGSRSCRVIEGQHVLMNGHVPAARAGTPDAPGALAPWAKTLTVKPGTGVRLKMINAAVARYFRLRLTDQSGAQIPLVRVGGEGGLLDEARLEGGTQGTLDTEFDPGEILLAPANRADVVAVIPDDAQPGDVLTIWTLLYTQDNITFVPSVPVLHLKVRPAHRPKPPYTIAAGDPVLEAIGKSVEMLGAPNATLVDPATLNPPRPGTDNPIITFTNTVVPAPVMGSNRYPSIDGVRGIFDEGVMMDFQNIPHIETSRYARVGNLLELRIKNDTGAHHPFHMHGFSIQPIRMLDDTDMTIFDYDYKEFVDTIDIQNGHTLVFRVRLDDRPLLGNTDGGGGAVGRWVIHCHIFHHAALGMISELVVLPEL